MLSRQLLFVVRTSWASSSSVPRRRVIIPSTGKYVSRSETGSSRPSVGISKWSIGVGLAVIPTVACLQGAILLNEYRKNHADAPFPISPSRGMVMVKSERMHLQKGDQPLRVLVIGDSLAAGVGISKQGTPVLPEAISKALSRSLGRPVNWTCIGTPGASAADIVYDILHMDDDDDLHGPNLVEKRLIEWQATVLRSQEWLRKRYVENDNEAKGGQEAESEGNLDDVETQEKKKTSKRAFADRFPKPLFRMKRWFSKVQNDISDFREKVVEKHADKEETERLFIQKRKMSRRRNSAVPPGLDANHFDVAVVLTGLNDLKIAFLPFMMQGTNAQVSKGDDDSASGKKDLKEELFRVLEALKIRMNLRFPAEVDDEGKSEKAEGSLVSATSSDGRLERTHQQYTLRTKGPLVVFPAMPASPLPVFRRAPLSWFILPLIRTMDHQKKVLADRFPNFVLFVDAPSNETLQEFEDGTGPLFNATKVEEVLLVVTDVTQRAKQRVEDLMKEHYQRWTLDQDNGGQRGDVVSYESAMGEDTHNNREEVYSQSCHDHLAPRSTSHAPPPGSSLVAEDHVHPNDKGYDFWGRHIAAAIVVEWEKEDELSNML